MHNFLLGYSYLFPLCKYSQDHSHVKQWFNLVTKEFRAYLIGKMNGKQADELIIDWISISHYLPVEDYELLRWLCQMHRSIFSNPYFSPNMFPYDHFSEFE